MNSYFEEDSEEPTFSLHDFKKWLTKQGNGEDVIAENSAENVHKEETKEEFKKRFKEKIRRRRKKRDE